MTNEPTVEISRRGVDRLKRGHVWIYRSDVGRTDDVSPGAVVRVVDGRGWMLGRAFYSDKSEITLRMLTSEDVPVDRTFFEGRIDAAVRLRESLLPGVDAVRLVHAEGDGLPGLVVDRYGPHLVVQALNQGTEARLDLILEVLTERVPADSVVLRNDARTRGYEGLPLENRVVRGTPPETVFFREGDLDLAVDLLGGQKTGGFLDQRDNRLRAAEFVRPGDRCLDAFSYTAGFGLHMARAGGHVTAVDISGPALVEAGKAAERNGLELERVEMNAFDWLKGESVEGRTFDVIVLDPPAFARNRKSLPGATRGYKEVNLRALQMLAPGGVLVTCSCSYHMDEQRLLDTVLSAAQDAGRPMQLLEKRGAGLDHPVRMGVPETAYLKCLILRRLD